MLSRKGQRHMLKYFSCQAQIDPNKTLSIKEHSDWWKDDVQSSEYDFK